FLVEVLRIPQRRHWCREIAGDGVFDFVAYVNLLQAKDRFFEAIICDSVGAKTGIRFRRSWGAAAIGGCRLVNGRLLPFVVFRHAPTSDYKDLSGNVLNGSSCKPKNHRAGMSSRFRPGRSRLLCARDETRRAS